MIGADHPQGLELADALYSSVIDQTVLVSSAKVAEAAKLMEAAADTADNQTQPDPEESSTADKEGTEESVGTPDE